VYLEKHMVNDSYDFAGMLCLYTDLFSRKGIYGVFQPMKEESFRSCLGRISSQKKTFLVKRRVSGRILYTKKKYTPLTGKNYLDDIAFCDKIKMSKYYEKANALYASSKEKVTWWK